MPVAVSRAVFLFWLGLFLGNAALIADTLNADGTMSAIYPSGVAMAGIAYSMAMLIFIMAPFAYVIEQISVGEDWARLASVVLFVTVASWSMPTLIGHAHHLNSVPYWFAVSTRSASLALAAYAIRLLYTRPAQLWFNTLNPKRY